MSTISPNTPLEYAAPGALRPRGQDPQGPRVLGLPTTAWLQILVIAGLMAALFRFNLARLWLKTNPFNGLDANWSHSLIIPLIGLFYLYVHRDELLKAPVRPILLERPTRRRLIVGGAAIAGGLLGWLLAEPVLSESLAPLVKAAGLGAAVWGALMIVLSWGLGHLVFGLLVFGYGIWPFANDYAKDLGMVITLFGTVLTLCGWGVMRIAWFPIAFLLFAIPWPTPFYSWIASPLQELAARVAVKTLSLTGVMAFRHGTKIIMEAAGGQWRTLNVAEACAGMRSLMTFCSLAAAIAFLSARPLWQKLVITASAVPIAIFCNVMRVSGQGLLDRYVSQAWSQGFAHGFAGLVMLVPAFFLILLVGWVLDHLFIEEVDDKERLARAAKARAQQDKVIAIPRAAKPAVAGVGATGAPAPVAVPRSATGKPAAPPAGTPTSAAPVRSAPAAPATPPGVTRVPPRPGLTPPRTNLTPARPPQPSQGQGQGQQPTAPRPAAPGAPQARQARQQPKPPAPKPGGQPPQQGSQN